MTANYLLYDLLVRLVGDKAATSDKLELLADLLTEANIDVEALLPEDQKVFHELINRLLVPTSNPS